MPALNRDDACSAFAVSPFPVRRDLLVIIFRAFQPPHSNYNITNRLPKGTGNPQRFVHFKKKLTKAFKVSERQWPRKHCFELKPSSQISQHACRRTPRDVLTLFLHGKCKLRHPERVILLPQKPTTKKHWILVQKGRKTKSLNLSAKVIPTW